LPGTNLRLLDAFQKANTDFDLICMANHNHITGYNVYTAQRLEDYLLRYLEGATKPDWDSLPASSSIDASRRGASMQRAHQRR